MARPTRQTPAIEDEICRRIALGGPASSLKRICDDTPELPARETVLRWLAKESDAAKRFRHKYEQARELYRNGREAQAKQTFQQAIRAYEAFEKLVSGKDIPAEAEGWVQERNNAIIATEE